MLKTENVYVYGVLIHGKLISAYAFRRPSLFYAKEEAIECFFSLIGFIVALPRQIIDIVASKIGLNLLSLEVSTQQSE